MTIRANYESDWDKRKKVPREECGTIPHQQLYYFFDCVGRDPDNEIVIPSGSGKELTKDMGWPKSDGEW